MVGHFLTGFTEPEARQAADTFPSLKQTSVSSPAGVAHSPDLCRFQGDSGRDSQQKGLKGETGDFGSMV